MKFENVIFLLFLVIILVVTLGISIEGIIFGNTIIMPLAGWIGFAAYGVLLLIQSLRT
tara:strand:+ start:795 stop:968 length:174 start_codon:yes stop_codon:yes gene_type:complete